MKPLHCTITRLSRCPCCQSSYTERNKKNKGGKKAARAKARKDIKKELN